MTDGDKTHTEMLSIGEASQRIDLPESTIRYYDKEFGNYLSIPRGKNNQRLFEEDHLQDLEYIRYLIKREELSVEEVRSRLNREEDYRDSSSSTEESADSLPEDPRDETTTEPSPSSATDPETTEKLKTLLDRLDGIDARLEELEERQANVEELLDMNLRRYNKLVEDL